MTDDTPCGGFRVWVGRPQDDRPDQLFYAVEQPQERYSIQVIAADFVRKVTQQRWRSRIKPYTHRIRPAQRYQDAAWETYQRQGVKGVQSVIKRLQYQHIHDPDREVVAHG